MSLEGGSENISRFQLIKNFFKDNSGFFKELQKTFDVDFFRFSDLPHEISYEDIPGGITPDGVVTDYAQTLEYIKKRYEGKSIKACFVFSDGTDTTDVPKNVDKNELMSNLAKESSAPFFTFAPNTDMEVKDIAISDISYNRFTFARNPWQADVTVKIRGYNNLKLPVTLKEGNNILSKRLLETGNKQTVRMKLSFTPYKVGTFLYNISIPVQPQEAISENNQVSFLVKVVRDKIRIMHVCGRPSWDEKFLRQALKNDPNVDLVSFFILRTPDDISGARNDELSLIPFPVDELFTQVLNTFDLVIFQNFDYRPYDSSFYRFSQYLNNIMEFVTEQGGGFLMVGGDLSFFQGGYDGTAIEQILPVDLSSETDFIDTTQLQAALTEDGLQHPITSLDKNVNRNIEIWEGLPKLEGCNVTAQLKSDSVVLATYPVKKNPPLISVRDSGDGRCMAITTDSLWRWNFISVGNGGSNRHYLKFWRNTIKWLIKDPVFDPVHTTINKDTFHPEEEIVVNVKVLGRNYQPMKDIQLDINVTNEFSGKGIFFINGETDSDGQYTFSFKHGKEGSYIINTMAKNNSGEIGQDSTVFSIVQENEEFKDPAINRTLLMKLAEVSGGKYFDLPQNDIGDKLSIDNPPITKLAGKRQISLWDNGYVFLLVISIVSLEWWIRKRKGLS